MAAPPRPLPVELPAEVNYPAGMADSNPRLEQPTHPDTLRAVFEEVHATNGKVDELKGRLISMDAQLARTREVLGEPSRTEPGAFPGDPPRIVPATGMVCVTLERLAAESFGRTKASNKRSVLTSGGVAVVMALVLEGLRAWNGGGHPGGPSATEPPHGAPMVQSLPPSSGK